MRKSMAHFGDDARLECTASVMSGLRDRINDNRQCLMMVVLQIAAFRSVAQVAEVASWDSESDGLVRPRWQFDG